MAKYTFGQGPVGASQYSTPPVNWMPQATKDPARQVSANSLVAGSSSDASLGVVDPMDQSGMSNIMGNALMGPQSTPYTIKGGFDGQTVLGYGNKMEQTLQPQDVFQAQMADRNAQQEAAKLSQKHYKEAMDLLGRTTSGVAAGARGRAEELPGRVGEVLKPYEGKNDEAVAEIQQRSRDITTTATEMSAEMVAKGEQRAEEAKGKYQDMTAQTMEMQRLAVHDDLARQKQDIIAQAGAQGMGADSPQVQAQMRQATAGAQQRLGLAASQASIAYNDTSAQIRMHYDDLQSSLEQAQVGTVVGAQGSTVQGLLGALAAKQSLDGMMAGYKVGAEQMRVSMHAVADQIELAGGSALAQMMRDMPVYNSPIAPIIAEALAIQQSEVSSNQASQQYVTSQSGARTAPSPIGSFGAVTAGPGITPTKATAAKPATAGTGLKPNTGAATGQPPTQESWNVGRSWLDNQLGYGL